MKITALPTHEGIYEDEHDPHGINVNTTPLEWGGTGRLLRKVGAV
jgi:hypothetical protein